MNEKELLDIYTDYLISSFGLTTGTDLSRLLDGAISHDQIQRFLASEVETGKLTLLRHCIIPKEYPYHTEQPLFCCFMWLYQIRNVE
ncbi:MAG: hypothetical protein ACPG7F_11115, partial [Aggregatilineales bacterium]